MQNGILELVVHGPLELKAHQGMLGMLSECMRRTRDFKGAGYVVESLQANSSGGSLVETREEAKLVVILQAELT